MSKIENILLAVTFFMLTMMGFLIGKKLGGW